MSEAQRLWTRAVESEAPESAGGRHDARDWQERSEYQNSNELAAQALAAYILGRRLMRKELRFAAPLVHHLFGAALGAIYWRIRGTSASRQFRRRIWHSGLARRGRNRMPLLGLSDSTARCPLEMHLQSLAAHLVYGTATEMTRRLARARFDDATPDAPRETLRLPECAGALIVE